MSIEDVDPSKEHAPPHELSFCYCIVCGAFVENDLCGYRCAMDTVPLKDRMEQSKVRIAKYVLDDVE